MFAHVGAGTTDVLSGLLHPLTGIDHVIAMVAVGAIGAVLRRPLRMPLAFIVAMVAGGSLGIAGIGLPLGEQLIAVSVVLLGMAFAAGAASNVAATSLLVLGAGFVHGHAHGVEAPTATHPLLYIVGFVVATAALHMLGVLGASAVADRRVLRPAVGTFASLVGVGLLTAGL